MKLGIGIYILTSEAESSQHTKAIDFSARPAGFHRAMVPNLPYFMVTVVMDMSSEVLWNLSLWESRRRGPKGGGEFPSRFMAVM